MRLEEELLRAEEGKGAFTDAEVEQLDAERGAALARADAAERAARDAAAEREATLEKMKALAAKYRALQATAREVADARKAADARSAELEAAGRDARALAERREEELRTVQRIIEQTETRAEAAEDAAADGVASAARDADSAVTNAAIKVRARGSTDPCSISHEKRSPTSLFSLPLSTRRVKNNAAIRNRAPRPRRRVSRASATPRRR